MTPLFKKYGSIMLSVIAAIAMIVSAYVGKDSEYENAWLYILIVFFFLFTAWEVYSKKNK